MNMHGVVESVWVPGYREAAESLRRVLKAQSAISSG